MSGISIAPEPLIQLLRGLLEEQGKAGRWLLGRIDDALEAGIEDEAHDGQLALHGSWPDQAETDPTSGPLFDRAGTDPVIRAPSDRWEILDIHLAVLEAHLVALPSCVAGAAHNLESLHVSDIAIIPRSDYLDDDFLGAEARQIALTDLVSPAWREKQQALWHLRSLVRAARS